MHTIKTMFILRYHRYDFFSFHAFHYGKWHFYLHFQAACFLQLGASVSHRLVRQEVINLGFVSLGRQTDVEFKEVTPILECFPCHWFYALQSFHYRFEKCHSSRLSLCYLLARYHQSKKSIRVYDAVECELYNCWYYGKKRTSRRWGRHIRVKKKLNIIVCIFNISYMLYM